MVSSFFERVRKINFWQKNAISIVIFIIFGIVIHLLSGFSEHGYHLFLIFVPLILTSSFYFRKWNLLPSFLATLLLLVMSLIHYGELFVDRIYISILNLSIFFAIFILVSVLIGMVNISFKNLKKEKESVESRNDFLSTLLVQDFGSKYQAIQGYQYLLKETELSKDQEEYLDKAINASKEVKEVLDLAKKLEEIEKKKLIAEKDVLEVLNQALEDIKDAIRKEGVEIKKDYKKIGKVEGNYSLKLLFSQIILTRVQKSGCDNVKISIEEGEQKIQVRIEDDGEKLPKNIQNIFMGQPYSGETTGVGGAKYYIIREIAEHNNSSIEVEDSELGGAKFDIILKKA